ncbi:MAG: CotH kinase family protein [Myxococcales bacterium]|nr:CotH kinase family protein [Myxococcales bacterium]
MRRISVALVSLCLSCGRLPLPQEGEPPGIEPVDPGGSTGQPPLTLERVPPALPAPGVESRPAQRADWPPLQESLPSYALNISQANLDLLEINIKRRDFEVPAQFLFGGRTWNVSVRYRGRHTRYLPKKSWQVNFPDGDLFFGKRSLELLAEWKDGGILTEKLWYDLYAASGVRAPSVRYVNLELNGKFYGVFTEIQAVKKEFLRTHGFHHDGDIYRCGMYDCELRELPQQRWMQPWAKRTNERAPWDGLWAFLAEVNRSPQGDFRARLERVLEVEAYLRFMAVDEFIAMYATGDSRSFLVYDPGTGKWAYVPWDLNNAVSLYNRTNSINQGTKHDRPLKDFTPWDPRVYSLAIGRRIDDPEMTPTWSVLATRVLEDEGLRSRYVAILRELLDTRFRVEEMGPRIDRMRSLIKDDLLRDPWIDQAFAERSPDFLKRYVTARRDWMLAHLGEIERHNDSRLLIDRVGLDASGAPFVQLYNPTSAPQSLAGLYLSFDLRHPKQSAAPALSVPPGDFVAVRPPLSFMADRPEVGLFDASGTSPLDLLYPGPLSAGQAYGRSPRGAESFMPYGGP